MVVIRQILWSRIDEARVLAEIATEVQDIKQAIKGEIPMWMNAKWAPMLLFQWSDGLRDAVLQAEEYVEEVL